MSNKPSKTIEVLVVGGGGVGKTAITIRYLNNHFIDEYDPTIEDCARKVVQIDDTIYLVEIFDTAGDIAYKSMVDMVARRAHAFVIVYCITSRISFDEVIQYYEQIKIQCTCDTPKCIVIGNKCDLDGRQVSTTEGEELASILNCKFIETSAKTGENVMEAFKQLVTLIHNNPENRPRSKGKSCIIQ